MRFVSLLTMLIIFFITSPAAADFDDAVNGVNGIATAGFDPIYGFVTGDVPVIGLDVDTHLGPLSMVTDRLAAGVLGVGIAFARVCTGVADVVTANFADVNPVSLPALVQVFAVAPSPPAVE